MLSKSLGYARETFKEFAHVPRSRSHLSRADSRAQFGSESIEDWAVAEGRPRKHSDKESSDEETSAESFVTSYSFQSNTTVHAEPPPREVAVIKDGPHRSVGSIRQGPKAQETYPVLDQVDGCYDALPRSTGTRDGTMSSSISCPQRYLPSQKRGQGNTRSEQDSLHSDPINSHKADDWRITESILYAYRAMLGCEQANNTEMWSWLRRCCQDEQDGPNGCVLLLQRLESQSIDSPVLCADNNITPKCSEPDASYEYGPGYSIPRPFQRQMRTRSSHCDSPIQIQKEPKEQTQYCNVVDDGVPCVATDFTDGYDISDGEGDSSTGRISPCTFRLWAAGCTDRNIGLNPKLEYNGFSQEQIESQSICETLDSLSDDISSHVSIVEGLEKRQIILDWQRRLRHHFETSSNTRGQQARADLTPLRSAGDVVTLTQQEVLNAISDPSAPPTFDGIPKEDVYNGLRDRYQLLFDSEKAESQMMSLKKKTLQRNEDLKCKLKRVTTRVEEIRIARARKPEDLKDKLQRRHRETIYMYLKQHLMNASDRYEESQDRLEAIASELNEMARQEERLVVALKSAAWTVGVNGIDNPDEIERQVLELTVESAEGKNLTSRDVPLSLSS